MRLLRIDCVTIGSLCLCSLASAQDGAATASLQPPVVMVDFVGDPFIGGLCFSPDGKRIWTDRLQPWSVPGGKQMDVSIRPTGTRRIVDMNPHAKSMLIATPKTGELRFWDQEQGSRQRVLKQTGQIAAARYIDKGKRFAVVFSKPASVYYGNIDSDEDDSMIPLDSAIYKCVISSDGNLLAVQNDRDIEIWDVKRRGIRTRLKHEHKPFSFTFSHDGQTLATGTSNDNMVRLYDTSRGTRVCELEAHTEGKIFLTSAVYSLAFSPNGKWLASGGHDGRVVVWDLEKRKAHVESRIEGPPIVFALAFSADSQFVACSFENASAKRGIRVWNVPGRAQ